MSVENNDKPVLPKVICKVCHREMLEMLYQSHITSHANEILPNWLYLGAERNVKDIWKLNTYSFTHVISVAEEVPSHQSTSIIEQSTSGKWTQTKVNNVHQYHVAIKDLPGQDMSVFTDFSDEIHRLKNDFGDNLKILVHCVQGISRSASVVMAYLVRYNEMTLKQAYDFVRERRPIANPRKEFIEELQNIERNIYGFSEPTLLVEDTHEEGRVWINVDPKTT